MNRTSRTLLALALAACSSTVLAADNDWFVRVGAHTVNPDSDNGRLAGGALAVDIGSDTRPTFAFGRMLNPHWAIEVLAALPFEHEVKLNGSKALDFKHLPPTVSLQYYFAPDATVNPFVSAGVNYTWTYDEKETGALAGTDVKIDNSFGLAAQAGLAIDLAPQWELVADIRWMDIDADVSVDGVNVGSVSVDPLVYGVYVGYKF